MEEASYECLSAQVPPLNTPHPGQSLFLRRYTEA
jgi:hypothetical protein